MCKIKNKFIQVFLIVFGIHIFMSQTVCLGKLSGKVSGPQAQDFTFEVTTPVKKHQAIKCILLCVGERDKFVENVAKMIKFDLEFTDQLSVTLKRSKKDLNKKIARKLFEQDTSLCLYVRACDKKSKKKKKKKKNAITIELKDTSSYDTVFEKTFLCDNRAEKENGVVKQDSVVLGHTIAHELLPAMTGEKSITLSSLVYCKQISSKKKVICMSDYACKKEKTIVGSNTLNVAPAWHSRAPYLFFSQYTRTNSRLMALDLFSKKQRIICSYDGLNMQPSFSDSGHQVVLCMSGSSGNSELYLYDQRLCHKLKRRVFQRLTKNHGSNASPCFLPGGNIIFCSDYQTGYPQIYHLDRKHKETRRLTTGRGYCAGPSYNHKRNAIVYTRFRNGTFQLFTLDLDDPDARERQLTFSRGDKNDPSWSPCGKYIAFTFDFKNKKTGRKIPQIAVFNCRSGKIRIVTSGGVPKSFPAWTDKSYWCSC